MIRRGGRYLVGGQVGPQEVPFRPTLITQNQLTITGSYSGSEAEYWRAIEFIPRTKDEYDFDQILSNRFRLDQVTDAFRGMQSMQEGPSVTMASSPRLSMTVAELGAARPAAKTQ
jgi:threonine dehydrogenase-like Zn-dependent dehydrogenase